MNAIKKIVIILMLSFVQIELSAQTNSSISVQLVDVNTLDSQVVNKANSNELITGPQTPPVDPNFILMNDSVLKKETILYDPKLMDIKPQ